MAGTHQGQALIFKGLTELLQPLEHKGRAQKIVDAQGASVTLLELAQGQSWKEHHSIHPIIVQVLKGKVRLTVRGQSRTLIPGQIIHLTDHLLHQVDADTPATVMVIMLTGENPDPKIQVPAEQL
ncbi:cupin domain-containing protein [Rothia sp. P6271]|uniref:cupin domain-containing protein n=1 Tax=unclassified Rothia (in: high G+C Gram-positive bacteria) TaxID=2689056 RepID=UPI003AC71A18